MLFTFFLSLREIYIGYCRVELKFKYISIQNVLLGMLYLMIIPLYFILNRLGIGVGYSIAGIAAFIIIILGMENLGRLNLRNYDIIKIFFKFGPYFLVGGFLHLFMRLLDRFFIAHFLGTDQVTVYFTAASTVLILAFPFSQLSAILLPIISQKKDFSDFKKKDVRNLVYFSVLTVSVVLICGLVFGKLIISILYGSDFYQLSKYCFFILLVSYSLQFMIHYTKHFIDVFLNPNVNLYTVIVAVILNIIGNYFFIPIWGIVGAALATSISLITYATMWFTIFLKKIYLQL